MDAKVRDRLIEDLDVAAQNLEKWLASDDTPKEIDWDELIGLIEETIRFLRSTQRIIR